MKKTISVSVWILSLFFVATVAQAINLGKIKLPGGNQSGGGSVSAPAPVVSSNDPANVKLQKSIEAYLNKGFPRQGKIVKADNIKQVVSYVEAKYGKAKLMEDTYCWLLIADKAEDSCIHIQVSESIDNDYETGKKLIFASTGGALCSSNRMVDYGVVAREVK